MEVKKNLTTAKGIFFSKRFLNTKKAKLIQNQQHNESEMFLSGWPTLHFSGEKKLPEVLSLNINLS